MQTVLPHQNIYLPICLSSSRNKNKSLSVGRFSSSASKLSFTSCSRSPVLKHKVFTISKTLNRSLTVKVTQDLAGSAPEAQEKRKGAYMHDFCLTIPYGIFLLLGGVVGGIAAGSMKSLMMGGGGGAMLTALGFLSLRTWKSGKSCTPYTLGSLLFSGMMTYMMGKRFMMTKAIFPAGVIAAVSGVMALFYIYNLIAGGNPAPKKNS
mmetsp:Transcript_26621/g.36751  ORF Transcript_26621/g.36751 Transcript_26621/m.36751 type:complete len:207 (+) Transcript_26621:57-677(+)